MSLVLNVEILGEFKKLTAATTGAQTDIQKMTGIATKASKRINTAFAAIGLGLSFRFIVQELKDASKAAVEDAKSMALLQNAMENVAGATNDQVAAAEASIRKLQLSASVADDQLRPAYQKLFLATKDVTESSKLLQIALDVSAGTGKNLDAVAQAMAKSLAGSDTALIKLIPSLKGSKDPINELAAAFAGAAEKAANTDPYQRVQIIFGELQEQIGMALLPVLNEFSTWLATPEGQEKMQQLVDLAVMVIDNFTEMAGWVLDNKDWLVPMVISIGTVVKAWEAVTVAINVAKAAAAVFGTTSAASGAAGALAGAAGNVAGTAGAVGGVLGALRAGGPLAALGVIVGSTATGSAPLNAPLQRQIPQLPNSPIKPGTQLNININTPKVNGEDVVNTINKYFKGGGTGTILRGGR